MTKSAEDYIEAIHVLIESTGTARVRDVAEALHVKMPSVVKAIQELKKLDLVEQEPYGGIKLTEKGRRCARLILGRHTLLKQFLLSLGVSSGIADKDACLMEHILSAETMDRIRDFLADRVDVTSGAVAAKKFHKTKNKKESKCQKTK